MFASMSFLSTSIVGHVRFCIQFFFVGGWYNMIAYDFIYIYTVWFFFVVFIRNAYVNVIFEYLHGKSYTHLFDIQIFYWRWFCYYDFIYTEWFLMV